MLTELFWIPTPLLGPLAVAPRPRGGDWLVDEMRDWSAAGIDVAVSMLTTEEMAEFELGEEPLAATTNGIRFVGLPVEDREVPGSQLAYRDLVADVTRELIAGLGVVVHCRQGIGRSGIVAAGVLIAAGVDADTAIAQVSQARGRPVPETPAQRRWLEEFAAEADVSTEVM